MNRRHFLRSTAATAAVFAVQPLWAARVQTESKVPDEEILRQANKRIEKHRKADGSIRLRDAHGQAVAGAKIRVQQLQHDFLFGSNFFRFNNCGAPELEQAYRQRFAALLNYCTLGFYWASYEAERGKPNYDYTDQAAAWTREHGITCKGHPLVWDHPASSPSWLPDNPKEIERLSLARVHDIVSRFQGRIDYWDVVNEATHLTNKVNKSKMADWAAAKGAVAYVSEHLKVARAANPQATLLVNDYRVEPPYYQILKRLKEGGKYLFDTVGIQSHMHDGVWPLHKVWKVCDTYGHLGLPIHFTESTIVSGPRKGPGENWGETNPKDEERQAELTANFYTTLFGHPSVRAITWWDFTDLWAWQGAPAGWLRRDMSPKPVYDRLMSLIKGAWWTKCDGVTNSRGDFHLRAYYGTQRITAELPAGQRLIKDVQWERGKSNHFELSV
jgi:GH35 family endo-1,4-beta-xylanase